MKYLSILLVSCVLFSCGNERILQLPEIKNASLTEIHDVSHAYLFYDETKKDSIELNRKNLISTTNWLVNVDKRLTLSQAIPKITFLQDKKRNAKMHKNENAKNYFTCNDTSIQNLGFIEFTDVNYITDIDNYKSNNKPIDDNSRFVMIHFFNNGLFRITEIYENQQTMDNTLEIESHYNSDLFSDYRKHKNQIHLSFDKMMSFQKYISLKHSLDAYLNEMSVISYDELIY